MNDNEFSNETVIPVEIFKSYRRWDGDKREYVVDQKIDPRISNSKEVPLGARNLTFLTSDKPLGGWVLHMAELEADVVRHMANLKLETYNRLHSLERISEKVVAVLRDQSVSEPDICEIFETINEDLPTGFELTLPMRKFKVKVNANIQIDLEEEVEVQATSEEEAEELVTDNPSDYVDLDGCLKDAVRNSYYDDHEFDIETEII